MVVSELTKGIQSILEACSAVNLKEDILVLADNETKSISIARAVMNAANSMGAQALLMVKTAPEFPGEEPAKSVAAAMKNVNAVFYISEKGGLAHTTARKEATEAGTRYYAISQIPVEHLKRGVSPTDIRIIEKRTERLREQLATANHARISTPSGTNITMSLTGREGISITPSNRIISFLPYYAEAAIAPLEGTAVGILVIDLAISGWGYLFREPLRCTVESGKVVSVSGDTSDVKTLNKLFSKDENAANIAELGIGTSHIIPEPIRGTRGDAGRLGTAHIGFGRNNDIGGNTWSHIHVDALMSDPIIELDNRCILRGNNLQ